MKFYTEDGIQDLANRKGKPVCAWIPYINGRPAINGDYVWVHDSRASLKDYRGKEGYYAHAFRAIFYPQPNKE